MTTTEQEAPAFYEPWTPEEGTRVRVRLSGECPFERQVPTTSHEAHHVLEAEGVTGVVIPCPTGAGCAFAEKGHRFVVKFDHEIKAAQFFAMHEHYAATELEPA